LAELEKFTEDIIIKALSSEPELGDDIKEVINLIIEGYKGNVILDFSQVDIMTASSTTTLQAAPVTFGYAFQFDTYRV